MRGIIYRLGNDPIAELKKPDRFLEIIDAHLQGILSTYHLEASLDEGRLVEAQKFWLRDLSRVGDRDFDGDHDSPDHFKHGAHLAYWLRRTKPIVDVRQTSDFPSGADMSAADAYAEEHGFFSKYITEYLAFDLGFHIALFYEVKVKGNKKSISDFIIRDWDYIETTCYFLNAKNVSPHAMNVVYRSLFL